MLALRSIRSSNNYRLYQSHAELRFINPAMATGLGVPNPNLLIGKFNLHDWHGDDFGAYELPKKLQDVLSGEVLQAANIPVPVQEGDYGFQVTRSRKLASVIAFPIRNEDDSIVGGAFLFLPHSVEQADPTVMRCRVWIDTNWHVPYDRDRLAKLCSMSPNHFTKTFKKEFGITPYQYYCRVRMERVRILLQETNLTILQAFQECGMKYNGSRANEFKKIYGLNPHEYRKKNELI